MKRIGTHLIYPDWTNTDFASSKSSIRSFVCEIHLDNFPDKAIVCGGATSEEANDGAHSQIRKLLGYTPVYRSEGWNDRLQRVCGIFTTLL